MSVSHSVCMIISTIWLFCYGSSSLGGISTTWAHEMYQYPFVCFYINFYFGIILDFHKSCKDIAETSCMSFPLLSLISPSHVTMAHLSELRNKHWYSTINYRLYLGFSSFSVNILFLFQDSIQVILRTIILVSTFLSEDIQIHVIHFY